jgi:NUMOD3 motif
MWLECILLKFYTYIHTRLSDNRVFYVGKGTAHDARAYSKKGRSAFWKRTVEKHGYIVSICMWFENEAEAFAHEKFLIVCFKQLNAPLANITEGGEGVSGLVHSEETRKKLSAIGKGRRRTMEQVAASVAGLTGQKRTVEQRQKMSLAQTGRVCKDTTREKLRVLNTGKQYDAISRAKRSAALKGIPKTAEHKAAAIAARLQGTGYKKGPEAALKAWATKRAKAALCTI